MVTTHDPDWRYANMTQSEIEEHVKARSSRLMSQTHFVVNLQGKKLKFRVIKEATSKKEDGFAG